MKQKDKKNAFIEKSVKVHGGYYLYDKVDYIDSQTKVCITCPKHGDFWQTPSAHSRGDSCPKCADERRGRYKRMSFDEFVKRANEVHENKFDYSLAEYKNIREKVTIICPEHGEFRQTPLAHILNGQGCPKCAHKGLDRDEIIKEFRGVHGDRYDYSKAVFGKLNDKVIIICPEHGEFLQSPTKHLSGQGCPKCAALKRREKMLMTTPEFIEKARVVHGDRYDYRATVYSGTYNKVKIVCPEHGEFWQIANDHLEGHGCPVCGNNASTGENEITDYIKSLGFGVETRNRSILSNGREIDIFVPEKNIGIEYDGLLWHSDKFKERDYHLRKTEECAERGVRLIHVFEDEWQFKKDTVKSMISNALGVTGKRIFARKCVVREIGGKEAWKFIQRNHIQGRASASVNIGLFHEDKLVSVMTFGKPRVLLGHKKKAYDYELIRFCSEIGVSVVGGAGKLLSYFIKTYSPGSIISYCDRRWGTGGMYERIGFKFDHSSQPNYFYVVGNNRKNRFRYNKSALVKMGYDKDKSEREITQELGIPRIYDCGTKVYVWKRGTD